MDKTTAYQKTLRTQLNEVMTPLLAVCREHRLSSSETAAALAIASYGVCLQTAISFDDLIAAVKSTHVDCGLKNTRHGAN